MKKSITCALVSTIACMATANTTVFDFENSGDLSGSFLEITSSGDHRGAGKFTQSTSNGINGSDGILASPTGWGGTQVYQTALAGDLDSFSVSMLFEFNPVATRSDSGAGLTLGFGSSNAWDGAFANTGGADDNQFMVGLTGITGGNRRLINYNVADGIRTSDAGDSVALTADAGSWYRLELAVVNNGNGTFDITSSLYDVDDTTGADLGGPLISNLTDDFASADFAGGANMYAFFGGQGGTDHRIGTNFDNFALTAVPEPSAYGLIAGILAIGIAILRRR